MATAILTAVLCSTGASDAFSKQFGFNQLQVSLMFIPIGVGSILSAITVGKLVDWNYRRHAKRLGFPVVRNRAQDLTDFPIEQARLEIAFPLFLTAGAFVIIYGWFLTVKLSLAAYVIALFIVGYTLTSSFQVLNVLMVDIYPGKPSIATAANNLVRCEIGAVFSAILLPLSNAIGYGWAYTFLALLFIAFTPVLLIIMKKGPAWRKAKKAKDDKASAVKEEKAQLREAEAASGGRSKA
jgi:MFS family permease